MSNNQGTKEPIKLSNNIRLKLWFWKVQGTWNQCLESRSVGSARFWFPGSGSAKICESTDPDPRDITSAKNYKKIFFTLYTQILTIEKREIIKISWFLNGSSNFNKQNSVILKRWPRSGSASNLNGSKALHKTQHR